MIWGNTPHIDLKVIYISSNKLERICQACGKTFMVWPSRIKIDQGKFCSRECAGTEAQKLIKNCIVCGKPFQVKLCHVDTSKYCSKDCQHIGRKKRKTVICQQCGKPFEAKQSDIERELAKYCSPECYHASRRKKVERTCPVCGKTFSVVPAEIARGWGIFCSKVCSNTGVYNPAYGKEKSQWARDRVSQTHKGKPRTEEVRKKISENTRGKKRSEQACKNMSDAKKGEKNPFWQGGISFLPYCHKFNEPFRERVRDFFDRKCVLCGKTETQNKARLAVHHVNHDKNTCCNDNRPLFVALCSKCHGKTHHDRDHFQKLYTSIIDTQYNGKCYL